MEPQNDPRYKARIAIFFGPDQNELLTDYSVNLSSGGLFVETVRILPVATELMVKFKLPNSDTIISCNARVAWTNEAGALKKTSLPFGMGLQFVDLSLESIHFVRSFLEKGEVVPIW